jgi:hypothetical protein
MREAKYEARNSDQEPGSARAAVARDEGNASPARWSLERGEKDPPSTHQHEVFAKAQPGAHIRRSLGHARGLQQDHPAQQIDRHGKHARRGGAFHQQADAARQLEEAEGVGETFPPRDPRRDGLPRERKIPRDQAENAETRHADGKEKMT